MPSDTLGQVAHNGIGLPTQDRHEATWPYAQPSRCRPITDPGIELAAIVRRSTKNGDNDPARPHRITLHMDGLDLVRFVQLAMDPKTTPITKE